VGPNGRRLRKRNNSSKGVVNKSISRMFNNTTIVPVRILLSNSVPVSTVAVIAELNLSVANLGDRIIDVGDTFSFFRIRKLHAYSFCNSVVTHDTVTENGDPWFGLAFTPQPNTTFTAPTTLGAILDFPEFVYGNRYQKAHIRVGPEGLYKTTPTHWYECGTQGSTQLNSAGTIISYGANPVNSASSSSLVSTIIEAEVEFKEPIDTGLIPLEKLKARVAREEKLLEARETKEEKTFVKVKNYDNPPERGLLSSLGFR